MNGRLLVAVDVLYKNWDDTAFFGTLYHHHWAFQFGTQYSPNRRLRLRAGYVYAENITEPNPGPSLGGVTPPGVQNAIQYVQAQIPAINQHRITGGVGIKDVLPGVDFEAEHFGAILCSRVLHFLDGSAVDASVRNMHRWLKPGGRLYLVADTPYGIWRKFIPVFEARRARGDRWPGLMIALENYLPNVPPDRPINGPPFMNLLDTELLMRTCEEAGFQIERASFIDRSDFVGLGRMDGRENAGVMAVKPA